MDNDLESYKIKELDTPEKLASVLASMKDGNRPIVTVEGVDGKDNKMSIEAVPHYGNINFFELNGKPVKREELQIQQKAEKSMWRNKEQSKEQEIAM